MVGDDPISLAVPDHEAPVENRNQIVICIQFSHGKKAACVEPFAYNGAVDELGQAATVGVHPVLDLSTVRKFHGHQVAEAIVVVAGRLSIGGPGLQVAVGTVGEGRVPLGQQAVLVVVGREDSAIGRGHADSVAISVIAIGPDDLAVFAHLLQTTGVVITVGVGTLHPRNTLGTLGNASYRVAIDRLTLEWSAAGRGLVGGHFRELIARELVADLPQANAGREAVLWIPVWRQRAG